MLAVETAMSLNPARAEEDDGAPGLASARAGETGGAGVRTSVTVVCSPRPRVGKTLAARLMVDFLLANHRPVAAFDANPNDPLLSEFLPAHTVPATVADTPGQMALFDRLIVNDGTPKVVDLASEEFDRFFEALRAIGFVEEAKTRSIDTVVLFLVENHLRSAIAYRNLLQGIPGITLVPVHNELVESYGAPWIPHPAVHAMPIHIPHLAPHLHGVIRRPGFSFADDLGRAGEQPTQLHKWVSRPFIAFRDLELRLSLADFAPLFGRRA